MKASLKPFIIISETIEYQDGSRLAIVRANLKTPTNEAVAWTYSKTKEGVIIIPIDEHGAVYIKKEWRLNRRDFVWELPSGWVEHEAPTSDDIAEAANRELQEEIGLRSNELTLLTSFYPTNHTSGRFHVFLARHLQRSVLPADDHEHLEIEKLSFPEAYKRVAKDQIPTAQVLVAFLLAEKYLAACDAKAKSPLDGGHSANLAR